MRGTSNGSTRGTRLVIGPSLPLPGGDVVGGDGFEVKSKLGLEFKLGFEFESEFKLEFERELELEFEMELVMEGGGSWRRCWRDSRAEKKSGIDLQI